MEPAAVLDEQLQFDHAQSPLANPAILQSMPRATLHSSIGGDDKDEGRKSHINHGSLQHYADQQGASTPRCALDGDEDLPAIALASSSSSVRLGISNDGAPFTTVSLRFYSRGQQHSVPEMESPTQSSNDDNDEFSDAISVGYEFATEQPHMSSIHASSDFSETNDAEAAFSAIAALSPTEKPAKDDAGDSSGTLPTRLGVENYLATRLALSRSLSSVSALSKAPSSGYLQVLPNCDDSIHAKEKGEDESLCLDTLFCASNSSFSCTDIVADVNIATKKDDGDDDDAGDDDVDDSDDDEFIAQVEEAEANGSYDALLLSQSMLNLTEWHGEEESLAKDKGDASVVITPKSKDDTTSTGVGETLDLGTYSEERMANAMAGVMAGEITSSNLFADKRAPNAPTNFLQNLDGSERHWDSSQSEEEGHARDNLYIKKHGHRKNIKADPHDDNYSFERSWASSDSSSRLLASSDVRTKGPSDRATEIAKILAMKTSPPRQPSKFDPFESSKELPRSKPIPRLYHFVKNSLVASVGDTLSKWKHKICHSTVAKSFSSIARLGTKQSKSNNETAARSSRANRTGQERRGMSSKSNVQCASEYAIPHGKPRYSSGRHGADRKKAASLNNVLGHYQGEVEYRQGHVEKYSGNSNHASGSRQPLVLESDAIASHDGPLFKNYRSCIKRNQTALSLSFEEVKQKIAAFYGEVDFVSCRADPKSLLLVPLNDTTMPYWIPLGCKLRVGRNCAWLLAPSHVVSRNHCEIFQEIDQYYIFDVGSSSGTFVNGQRLSGSGALSPTQCINNYDIIQIGVDHTAAADPLGVLEKKYCSVQVLALYGYRNKVTTLNIADVPGAEMDAGHATMGKPRDAGSFKMIKGLMKKARVFDSKMQGRNVQIYLEFGDLIHANSAGTGLVILQPDMSDQPKYTVLFNNYCLTWEIALTEIESGVCYLLKAISGAEFVYQVELEGRLVAKISLNGQHKIVMEPVAFQGASVPSTAASMMLLGAANMALPMQIASPMVAASGSLASPYLFANTNGLGHAQMAVPQYLAGPSPFMLPSTLPLASPMSLYTVPSAGPLHSPTMLLPECSGAEHKPDLFYTLTGDLQSDAVFYSARSRSGPRRTVLGEGRLTGHSSRRWSQSRFNYEAKIPLHGDHDELFIITSILSILYQSIK